MNFKSYPKKADTPQRMSRKRMRRDVFVANKKAAKAARKERRLFRRQLEATDESL